MSDNWVVQNLQKSLSTWNNKFAEVWKLLTQSPEDFKGELDETSVGFSDKSTGGRKSKIYNLDMILSVGYRVNSKRCIAFRKWANNVLKQFILKGYAINEKRLEALEKTVDIQSRMLADALDIEESDVLRAVNEYTNALLLLDQYDHQVLCKPEGNKPIYRITYEECVIMVGKRTWKNSRYNRFGISKCFWTRCISICRRKSCQSLFLEFLDKNNALFKGNGKRFSDGTLVALTLMIAESKPEEKDIMVKLVMNLMNL